MTTLLADGPAATVRALLEHPDVREHVLDEPVELGSLTETQLSPIAARLPMSGDLDTGRDEIIMFDGDLPETLEQVAREIETAYRSGYTIIGKDTPDGELVTIPRTEKTAPFPRHLEVLRQFAGG